MTETLGRRLWATGLTGVPFGIFKLGTGVWLEAHVGRGAAIVLLVWGVLDIGLNVLSVAWPQRFSYCALSNLGRQLERRTQGVRRWEAVALALDTLLSFLIVAGMIWFRLLPQLPPLMGRVWDVAVVANIVGVGVERLWWTWRTTDEVTLGA